MKILHVLNDFPYPPTHGGRVDMWGRLQALAELGHDVHAIVTTKKPPSSGDFSPVKRLVHKLDMVERCPVWAGIANSRPFQVLSRRKLMDIELSTHYETVLSEAEFCFPIFENQRLQTDRKIIRVHNEEARFMREMSRIEPNWMKRTYYHEEARRFEKFSPRAFRAVDGLWFSSCDQHGEFSTHNSDVADMAVWLPPPVILHAHVAPTDTSSKQVLFVGSLSVRSNIEAIDWYMSGVHPKLKDIGGYRFMIVGSTRGQRLSPVIERALADDHCEVRTDVADLTELYRSSGVFVNCMLHGASIKMKTVNAAAEGLPIVSTTVGNEGTGFVDGQHVCIADLPEGFAAAIRKLLASPRYSMEIAVRAQDFLRSRYRHSAQLSSLLRQTSMGVS